MFSSVSYVSFFLHPPQVDLGFLRFVSAIGTQGAVSQETHKIYFVKSYKVDVSSNGEDWITLKEGSKQKVRYFITVYHQVMNKESEMMGKSKTRKNLSKYGRNP